MTDAEYQDLKVRAEKILSEIAEFPAHEMMVYEDQHQIRRGPGRRMWAGKLETEDA